MAQHGRLAVVIECEESSERTRLRPYFPPLARDLKTIATRDPLQPYTADDRLHDFRDAFGQDRPLIESGFLRFHDRLAK